MADILDKVIDTARKLRKVAKKFDDHETQNLIVDLNLHLADLKMYWAELQAAEAQTPREGQTAPQAESAPEPKAATQQSNPLHRFATPRSPAPSAGQ